MNNLNHLLKVTSAWISIVYTICYAGVWIYSPIRDLFMKYALHSSAPLVSDYFGFGYFISGLIIWNILGLLGMWLFVTLYRTVRE